MGVNDSLLLTCLNTFILVASLCLHIMFMKPMPLIIVLELPFFSIYIYRENKECNINRKINIPKYTSTPRQPTCWKGTSSSKGHLLVTTRNFHSSADINKMQYLKETLRMSKYNLQKHMMFRNTKSMKGEDYLYDHYNIPWHLQNKHYFPDAIRKEMM